MNYLAHAYLSFEITDITVGNMISDFVKGKQKLDYPFAIQQGIVLHRAIDSFTDSHAVTRQAKSFFKEAYGLYAGPLVDVVYDHFLANDPLRFPETGEKGPAAGEGGGGTGDGVGGAGGDKGGTGQGARGPGDGVPSPGEGARGTEGGAIGDEETGGTGLKAFAQKTYERLSTREALMPERFGRFFPYMRAQDWLFNYRYKQGILNSFEGLARRAAYMGSSEQAGQLFEKHYSGLEACYTDFFPALQDFALRTLEQLQEVKG
jgi:acyl carrier protein phosphodiesterase